MKSDYTQLVRCFPIASLCAALLFTSALEAQGTTPKEKASDYPAHTQVPGFNIGAEYLVHSVPSARGVIDVHDYLVIEVAVFPASDAKVAFQSGDFTLRINGKKAELFSQTPGLVAASVKYPDWETRPALEATAGIGDAGVILGRPPMTARFPGDNRPELSRLPPRPTEPEQPDSHQVTSPDDVHPETAITRAAFPDGPVSQPVSGCLFFAFKGKTKSIHSLELLYRSPDRSRETTLKLF